MRKTPIVALAIISILLLGATAMSYSKYRKSVADYTQATTQQEEMRQRYERAVGEISTIQDSLNAIVMGEDEAKLLQARLETEVQLPETRRDQVLDQIALLKAGIERTKERIQELDSRLKRSGVKIHGLEKTIASLKSSVAEREVMVTRLSGQVDSLETQVAGLSTEVETKQQELTASRQDLAASQQETADRQRELATIFYAVGKKKDLERSGVVVSQGGLLGVGKTLKPSGQFSEAAFTPLNTDQETVIRIPAPKAQILSSQPVSSYVIQPVGKDAVELRIVDPKEFRKVKHLVILTS